MKKKVKDTLMWLKIYNASMAFLYFLALGGITLMAAWLIMQGQQQTALPTPLLTVAFVLAFALGLIPFIVYLFGMLKVNERKKSIWILQIILVGLGIGSMLTLVPCIFLLINLLLHIQALN